MVSDDVTFDAKDLRVTFLAGDDIWALKFGSPSAFERFLQKCVGLCGCPPAPCKIPEGSQRAAGASPTSRPAPVCLCGSEWGCLPACLPCRYNKAAFENRYGQEQTDASEVKVGGHLSAGSGGSLPGMPRRPVQQRLEAWLLEAQRD